MVLLVTSASGVNLGSQAVNTGPPVANNDAYAVDENATLTTANPLPRPEE